MVDLKAIPYNLSDEDAAWVMETIAGMSDEEKTGQLFFQLCASQDEAYLKDLVENYHIGGARYNGMPSAKVLEQNRILQKYAKIPVFIACNPEMGGSGAAPDGTTIGAGVQIGATRNLDYAEIMGRNSAVEAAAMGCNMAFAPVADILYNWENTEVVKRSFGLYPDVVAQMSDAYVQGAHKVPKFACAAKHFPGNGQDFRDAHMSNNLNMFGEKEWMESYGLVYKTMIENGLDAIMGGHIMMPTYMKELNPDIQPEELMPATLCPEIMTGLLRDKLGFNGMVVTDASHMIGMTDRMKRCDMLPKAINAGCDMFLFFNDPKEDFETMLNAYKTGIISEERMTEALTRIIGLKVAMGLTKGPKDEICPAPETLPAKMRQPEFTEAAKQIAADAITLVKYKDEGVLPITPEKYPRIMIAYIKGAAGAMDKLAAMAMGGAAARKTPAEKLRDKLIAKGFDCFIYESPLDKMMKQIEAGEKPSLNVYFAGKNAIADFVSGQDLVITLFDVNTGRPAFGFSKGGGEIPWYVFELPVVGISVNTPTMLADTPQLRTYINAYASNDDTLDALIDKLMTGPDAFKGQDPIDSFCGLIDARI